MMMPRGVLLTEADARTRAMARAWQASGSPADLTRWLRERFRSGETVITMEGPRGGMELTLAPRSRISMSKAAKTQGKLALRRVEDQGLRIRYWHTREDGAKHPGGSQGMGGLPAKFDIGLKTAAETFVGYNRSEDDIEVEEAEYWRKRNARGRTESIAEAKRVTKKARLTMTRAKVAPSPMSAAAALGAGRPDSRVYKDGRGKWWARGFGSQDDGPPAPFASKSAALAWARRNEEMVRARGVTDADEQRVLDALNPKAPEKRKTRLSGIVRSVNTKNAPPGGWGDADRVTEAKKAPKVVEAAVEAWRLYLGSVDKVRPKQEERLTVRAQKAVAKAAAAMGVPFVAMQTAVDREARKRGPRLPRVGQDI